MIRPDDIERFRRFARSATTELGALDASFLGRGRPLGAARVLNAIGRGLTDLSALRAELGLDSGLASRLLRDLETERLIRIAIDPSDARRRRLELTASGEIEFRAYERISDAKAVEVLERSSDPRAVLDALDRIATVISFNRIRIDEVDGVGPQAKACLRFYYAELAKRFEEGFHVSRSRDPAPDETRPSRGGFFIASLEDLSLGCVALKRVDDRSAEIKRLWVKNCARGLGLAGKMLDAAELKARDLGIEVLRLDTHRSLTEAARLYQRRGWTEIPRFNDDPYADRFFEKALT